MRKDRIYIWGKKGFIFYVASAITLICAIIALAIYLIIITNLIIQFTLFGGIMICALLPQIFIQKVIEFSEETISVRSLVGKIKKAEDYVCLNTVAIKNICMFEKRNWATTTRFYCLYFEGYNGIMDEHSVQRIRKTPHLIAFTVTKQSTEMLKKYLPEKWLPYLDQPVEK